MGFNGYLTNVDINELTVAAVGSNLTDVDRSVILNGIPPAFVAGLRRLSSPMDQFTVDLVEVNRVERMDNGSSRFYRCLRIAWLSSGSVDALRRVSSRRAKPHWQSCSWYPQSSRSSPPSRDHRKRSDHWRRRYGGYPFSATSDRNRRHCGPHQSAAIRQRRCGASFEWRPLGTPGTAWLIAPGTAITNHHVVNARRSEEPPASSQDLEKQA